MAGGAADAVAAPEQAAPPSPVAAENAAGGPQDVAALQRQADSLAASLDEIRQRIAQIQGQ
jgi:hypothetical protein